MIFISFFQGDYFATVKKMCINEKPTRSVKILILSTRMNEFRKSCRILFVASFSGHQSESSNGRRAAILTSLETYCVKIDPGDVGNSHQDPLESLSSVSRAEFLALGSSTAFALRQSKKGWSVSAVGGGSSKDDEHREHPWHFQAGAFSIIMHRLVWVVILLTD